MDETINEEELPGKPGKYDSPWKSALQKYFPQAMEFFFPHIHQDIDWEEEVEFLNTELQQIINDTDEEELKKRLADSLVKVFLKSGEESNVMIHVEIQGDYDSKFAERMYIYNYRIYDARRKKVASLAILADSGSWQPKPFEYQLWGSKTLQEYEVKKLNEFSLEYLQSSTNPFAAITEAHLKSKETASSPQSRYTEKIRIIKGL